MTRYKNHKTKTIALWLFACYIVNASCNPLKEATPYSHKFNKWHKLLRHFLREAHYARSLYTVHTHLLHNAVIQGTTIAQVVKALFESMDFHANVSKFMHIIINNAAWSQLFRQKCNGHLSLGPCVCFGQCQTFGGA